MPAARHAQSETGDPLLLTPGPLTTAKSVKEVMVHDWGSRDATFLRINREVMERLPEIVHGEEAYVTVPMQGSGTFAVEAMLTTFVPPGGKVLVLINGAYGQRAKRILEIARRKVVVHETPEDTAPDLGAIERLLTRSKSITHVFAVYCETTSGIRNPIEAIADICARTGKRLLVDAMSAFGALPLDDRLIRAACLKVVVADEAHVLRFGLARRRNDLCFLRGHGATTAPGRNCGKRDERGTSVRVVLHETPP